MERLLTKDEIFPVDGGATNFGSHECNVAENNPP